jgi:hypothetical protein
VNPSLKIARPGWSANTAPDWALVFSSEWPSLQIGFETTVDVSIISNNPNVNHPLNFTPVAMAWISVNDINYGRIPNLEVTDTFINISLPTGVTTGIITIRCYNIDIRKEASYPLPTSAAAPTAPDLTTGIKIIKPNNNIKSPNLNDFILHSQAQSPAVLEIATQDGQYFESSYTNPQGKIVSAIKYPIKTSYIPWVLGAVGFGNKPTNTYFYYNPQALLYDNDSNSLILQFGEVGNVASLIILRDPLFYPNPVRVVF